MTQKPSKRGFFVMCCYWIFSSRILFLFRLALPQSSLISCILAFPLLRGLPRMRVNFLGPLPRAAPSRSKLQARLQVFNVELHARTPASPAEGCTPGHPQQSTCEDCKSLTLTVVRRSLCWETAAQVHPRHCGAILPRPVFRDSPHAWCSIS
jgi:hypothetical protein